MTLLPVNSKHIGSQDGEKDGFNSVTENICLYEKIYLYTHTHTCMYVHTNIHACVYICIYVYIHIYTAVGKGRFAVVTFF